MNDDLLSPFALGIHIFFTAATPSENSLLVCASRTPSRFNKKKYIMIFISLLFNTCFISESLPVPYLALLFSGDKKNGIESQIWYVLCCHCVRALCGDKAMMFDSSVISITWNRIVNVFLNAMKYYAYSTLREIKAVKCGKGRSVQFKIDQK